ncbi:Ankyrin repeat-containing domain [Trinorchestia longiramus]|nr:Ankyrin repeat-containing domain [Trinorchestia longiramus]
MAEVGVRVVRGPDWQWGDQDGGEGFCGTVVEVGRPGSSSTPDRTVVVHWDMGARTNYRVGYQSAYDLRLLDNAPVGVKHANHICDGCKKQGIHGLQWSCTRCYDFDLCTECYMADKHDTAHPFRRLDSASTPGVDVPPRKNSTKVPLQGIFVGAKVVRGPDWDWGNQDGGVGEIGRVTEIRGWDGESSRSVASVVWGSSGVNNVYRLGHKGKVDLKCEQPATCGHVYINHLPVLGRSPVVATTETTVAASAAIAATAQPPFVVGERVKVCVSLEQLRDMQEGHGGWNHKMADYVGQVGLVHRITDKGDVRVQYEGCCTRWTIHPSALVRVGGPDGGGQQTPLMHSYTPGDRVTVSADEERVKVLQKSHGEWIDYMKSALGKTGVVSKVYPDGDLRVNVDGKTWTFSPLCVSPITTATVNYDDRQHGRVGPASHHDTHRHSSVDDTPISNTSHQLSDMTSFTDVSNDTAIAAGNHTVHAVTSDTVAPPVAATPANRKLVDKLVREAAQGHLSNVNAILSLNPELLEFGSNGKTALQVACHQGHLPIVRHLLDRGAKPGTQDQDGDTSLHYAAFGNQVEVLELLLRRGSAINALNCGRCTALHVAVNKQHQACVVLLLRYGADANIQDSYGDTALHDAIGKDSLEIVEALTNWPRLNLTRRNNRGFNVLHHAALKGNNYATEKLVYRGRQFVDERKDDGFAALHLACLNGHRHVAETLLKLGRADPNLTNNKRQTPLLLAIAQGHVSLIELLVAHHGADVNRPDEDGETALHLTLLKLNQPQPHAEAPRPNDSHSPLISEVIMASLPPGSSVWLAVACLLVRSGANISALNARGVSPLQSVTDLSVVQALQSFSPDVTSGSGAALSDTTRLDLDMKALDLAAESIRSTVVHEAHRNIGGSEAQQGATALQYDAQQHPVAPHRSTSQPASPARFSGAFSGPCQPAGGAAASSASQPASPAHVASALKESGSDSCTICLEAAVSVRFEPCGHSVTCVECAARVKKCLHCHTLVVKKVRHDGVVLNPAPIQPSSDRLRYLESKIADIEEAHCCSICMERRRSVAFLCGHSACAVCSQTLTTCHMCRKVITNKINLY